MNKTFVALIILFSGVLLAPVYSTASIAYYCVSTTRPSISNGLGVKGGIVIYPINWESPQADYWAQINIQDYDVNHVVEGGLRARKDSRGVWHFYLFMSVMDDGHIMSLIKQEEVTSNWGIYRIQLVRMPLNPNVWQMWVKRPGSSSYELWYSYNFRHAWVGQTLESQTEGTSLPKSGQYNFQVAWISEMGWLDANRNWKPWPNLKINGNYWNGVDGEKETAVSWYTYISRK